jgi:hypothetical protein
MPVEAINITQNSVEVRVNSTGEKFIVSSPKVQIVTAGKVGPPGPPGTNADGTFEWVTQSFTPEASQREFTLSFTPRAGSVSVYLNGLSERFWSLSGLNVTLEDPTLVSDSVMISYQKEI